MTSIEGLCAIDPVEEVLVITGWGWGQAAELAVFEEEVSCHRY
jgi:hypothetical protein